MEKSSGKVLTESQPLPDERTNKLAEAIVFYMAGTMATEPVSPKEAIADVALLIDLFMKSNGSVQTSKENIVQPESPSVE